MNIRYKLQQLCDQKELIHVLLPPLNEGPIARIIYVGDDYLEVQTYDLDDGMEYSKEIIPFFPMPKFIIGGESVQRVKEMRIIALAAKENESVCLQDR